MIVVTGTKRSGTSMWMQLLAAGGVDVLGEAFPRDWEHTIADANPQGFYESPLRWGLTDERLARAGYDECPTGGAVKVFVPGLIRTPTERFSHVIACVRHWREYAASIARLRQMERNARSREVSRPEPDAIWEWWVENFALVRDVTMRDYAVRFATYEDVLRDPERVLPSILEWAGVPDIAGAIAVVSQDARTQQRAALRSEHEFAHRFDELHDVIRTGRGFSRAFIDRLNQTHTKMIQRYRSERLPHPIPLDLIRH